MPRRDEVLTGEAAAQWESYLDAWETLVYQRLFAPRGISRDAALTTWFANHLRNALVDDDDDAGNEPWRA